MAIEVMKREFRSLGLEKLKDILCKSEVTLAEGSLESKVVLNDVISIFERESIFTDCLRGNVGSDSGVQAKYNTYPYGQRTNRIFPLMVASCSENQQLARTLHYMVKHGYDYHNRVKTMILFTVKWDLKIFKKFETKLLRLFLNYGIDIMFILVTDYGFTEIPFRELCRKLRSSGFKIDSFDEDLEDSGFLPDFMYEDIDPIVEYYSHPGTWMASHPGEMLFIDLVKCHYYKGTATDFNYGNYQMHDLPKNMIRRFIRNTQFVKRWEDNYDPSYIFDAGSWSLHIYGKTHKGQATKPKDFDRFWTAVEKLIN